jgi:hypothetical protein
MASASMLIQGGAALAQACVNVPGTTPLQVLQTNSLTTETRYTQPAAPPARASSQRELDPFNAAPGSRTITLTGGRPPAGAPRSRIASCSSAQSPEPRQASASQPRHRQNGQLDGEA